MIAHEVEVVRVRLEEEMIARRFKNNTLDKDRRKNKRGMDDEMEEDEYCVDVDGKPAKKRAVKRDVDLTKMMEAGRAKVAKKEV